MNNLILKLQSGNKFISYTGRDGNNYEAWRGGSDWYYRLKGTNGMTRVPYNYITPNGIRFYNTTDRGPVAFTYDDLIPVKSSLMGTPAAKSDIIVNAPRIPASNNQQKKLVASPNSLKSQTSLKAAPKTSLSSTNVVNNQQKRSVSSTSVQPKSSRNNTLVRNTNSIINKPLYTRAYKQRVSNLGLKDSEAVKAMLRQLGVKDDGIWGNKTEAAYQALQGNINGIDFTNSDLLKPISKPNYNISTVGTIDERGNITLNNPNTKPISKYNNFLNLNTLPKLLDNINIPLSKFTFAKKGSKLVSRNPIERFRNK